jgi:valyl-tRNA synthetase
MRPRLQRKFDRKTIYLKHTRGEQAMKYDVSAIETKWQKKWEEAGIFNAQDYS